MTVVLGTYGNNGAGGWTTFTQSAGGRLIYVSTSGSDAADGLTTGTPVKTLDHAWSLVTSGHDDWVLLKRGDTWTGEWFFLNKSGASANAPILISAYGTGARPKLVNAVQILFNSGTTVADFIAVTSIDCTARSIVDPSVGGTPASVSSAIFIGYRYTWLLFEDLNIEWLGGTYPGATNSGTTAQSGSLIFRRCTVHDNPGILSQGCMGLIVGNVHDLLIEENVFNKNGYHSSWSSIRNSNYHNFYIEDDCTIATVRGNIIANAVYDNLKCRCGGNITNNLILRSAEAVRLYEINAGNPYGWYSGSVDVSYNVVLDSRASGPSFPTNGGGAFDLGEVHSAPYPNPISCFNNIVANSDAAVSNYAYLLADGFRSGSVIGNVAYNWGQGLLDNGSGNNTTSPANKIKLVEDGSNPFSWPNRFVTPGTYYATIGGTNNTDAFLDRASLQNKGDWNAVYTAQVVNNYFRTNFGMATLSAHNGGRTQVGTAGAGLDATFPFLNAFKYAQQWAFADHSAWDPSLQDANGYMTSLGGHSGGVEIGLNLPTQAERPGNWVLLWDSGQAGVTTFSCNTACSLISGSLTGANGRAVIVNSAAFIVLGLQVLGSPYPTNIRFVHVDDEASLAAGGIFTEEFLALMRNVGVIRFMDWQSSNTSSVSHWADRKPVTYYNYATNYYPPSLVTTNQATNGGSGNTYTLTRPGFVLTDKAQVICRFQQDQTATGTLNVNGTGAISIGDPNGIPRPTVNANDPIFAGQYNMCTYDQSLNRWMIANTYNAANGINGGVPPEICLELCIQTGSHPWFNIPYMTCDWGTGQLPSLGDYTTQLATYCNANQPSWMVPRFETVNECWNSGPGFFGTQYAWNKQEVRSGNRNENEWIGTTGSLIGQAVSAAYSADRSRYQMVAGFKWSDRITERITSAYYVSQGGSAFSNWATHLCYASYFSSFYWFTPAFPVMCHQWVAASPGAAKDAVLANYLSGCGIWDGVFLQCGYCLPQFYTQVDAFATFAATYNVGVTFYEGGFSPDDWSASLLSITSIAKGATTVLTLTTGNIYTKSTINAAIAGMTVTISGVTGLTALNGNSYTVLSATPTTITLNVDSSAMPGTAVGGIMSYDIVPSYGTAFQRATKWHSSITDFEVENFEYLFASGAEFPSEYQIAGQSAFTIWDPNTYSPSGASVPPRWQAMIDFNDAAEPEPEPETDVSTRRPRIRLR